MLDADQVLALAPDAASASAARKTASKSAWKELGSSERALWGKCQGSAVYDVRVDLNGLVTKCSCPSRKFPCKHALGLLLLYAREAAALPKGDPPPWAAEWLAGRDERAQVKAEKAATKGPVDEVAREKREAQRQDRVEDGLEGLRAWLSDVGRTGLASVETDPEVFDRQAARLVDAQCPGLASRLRECKDVVGSGPDWPDRLIARLGRLALVVDAWGRRDRLPAPLVEDLRTMVGFTTKREDVIATGTVSDRWIVLGQRMEEDAQLRSLRTWLRGVGTGRDALVLQFSPLAVPGTRFPERFVTGTVQEMALAFWPSAFPQRALVATRAGAATPTTPAEARPTTVAAFLASQAAALAASPFVEALPCVLEAVVAVPGERWSVQDATGGLPLHGAAHFTLLAASMGYPVALAGEWDGEALRPLWVAGRDGACVLGAS